MRLITVAVFRSLLLLLGWLNAFKEGGWLPSWASPGYRNCMVGTFADVVVSDALVKNVPGFDRRMAIQALLRDVRCLLSKRLRLCCRLNS